jgi:predicted transcriptional regulator of viral defense system
VPGSAYNTIYEIAADQSGYVTTAQAGAAGISKDTLGKMAVRGVLERVSWGLYRLVQFPISDEGQYVEATLWPLSIRGTISHESALALYGLSDVNPAKIHITIPRRSRIQREVPRTMVIHRADLSTADTQVLEGIPITTPERAIRDCHAAHLGPALVGQAIRDGRRTGHLRANQARALERELLGTETDEGNEEAG